MKLYNTVTKKKEEFKPLTDRTVGMYVCGPTVYDVPTLGNLRTYLNADFLRRTLEFFNYKVNEIVNITDIEDKIIKKSQELNVPYTEITNKYEKLYLENIALLNIERPVKMPHATAEIPEMIKIIEKLLTDGYAYKSEDGSVYFDISKYKNYGRLSGLENRELKACTREIKDEYDKDNIQDFALWKAPKEGEPSWEAPFGSGRPGWHIECTAMSTKYLGDTVDIHAGAVDLIFPHHENEIAQSEAYTGKPFVRYWFHPEHLLIDGKRMGKSLGNFYTLNDLEEKFQVSPLAFRLLAASTHYRDRLNLTADSLKSAELTLQNLYVDVLRIKRGEGEGKSRVSSDVDRARKDFNDALSDDLAMPKALSALFVLLNAANKKTQGRYNLAEKSELIDLIVEMDKVLGLSFDTVKHEPVPNEIITIVKKREVARAAKDFKESDVLREKIEKLGYLVEDTADGPEVRKK